MPHHYLKALFDPTSVALIGATEREGTFAHIMTERLLKDYSGKLYFVNPKHKTLKQEACYKSVDKIEEQVDLAIVVTPLKYVIKVLKQCAEKGIVNVFLATQYANHYKAEVTPDMKELLHVAKELGVRVVGPNATALIRTASGLNASLTDNEVNTGKLALVTRSHAICSSIVDWADAEKVGFSSVISHGSGLDIDLAEILDFLASDHRTSSIIIHINQVVKTRRLMSALKAAALRKPVVILKSSHDNGSYSDAISKTKDVRGMDDVFHAAVMRAGADHVSTLTDLYAAAKILASNQRTAGNKLAIISNGYGPVMLANDRLRDVGLEMISLSKPMHVALKQTATSNINYHNALVIPSTDYTPGIYAETAKKLLDSDEVDALAVILAPNPLVDSIAVASALCKVTKGTKKPVLAIWLGVSGIKESRTLLTSNKISNYRSPESAIDAFSYLCHHLENKKNMLQMPYPLSKTVEPNLEKAREIVNKNLKKKRNVLSRVDAISLLEAFHIKCNPSLHAESIDDALEIAGEISYPVALKIDSQNLTYKSDVEGVKLNIENKKMLKKAYLQIKKSISKLRSHIIIDGIIIERMYTPANARMLNLRIINDPAFGPVICFGPGGAQASIMRDRAIQLPPLNRRLAENLINNTQVSLTLDKFRNLPATNRVKLRHVLIRLSEIAIHLPQVFELTINPLILDENDAIAGDVQVVVNNAHSVTKYFDHLAIHPYPSDWRRSIIIKNKKQVEVRPIRAEDAQAEVEFMKCLSRESKYFRFMHAVNDLTPEMLSRFTKLDYDREMAFGAFIQKKKKDKLLGVSRYAINPDKQSCEFAIVIADKYQGMGLARQLMMVLIEHVKDRDLKVIEGTVLKNNTSMDKLMDSLGFVKSASPDDFDINIYRFEFDS